MAETRDVVEHYDVGPSDSMRRAIAELWGFDPETWPAHGNWQLAVTAGIALDKERIATLRAWVDDLQSGMFVNCVYCGHRYGPKETTPVSMADALREHIEFCPDHPMSALRAENERLRNRLKFHARADALRGSA
jgi:hypothetical protein